MSIALIIANLILIYFGIGFLFGIYFLLKGAVKIDPLLANSKKRVRLLLLPGIIATWPLFIVKLFKSKNT